MCPSLIISSFRPISWIPPFILKCMLGISYLSHRHLKVFPKLSPAQSAFSITVNGLTSYIQSFRKSCQASLHSSVNHFSSPSSGLLLESRAQLSFTYRLQPTLFVFNIYSLHWKEKEKKNIFMFQPLNGFLEHPEQ